MYSPGIDQSQIYQSRISDADSLDCENRRRHGEQHLEAGLPRRGPQVQQVGRPYRDCTRNLFLCNIITISRLTILVHMSQVATC